MKRNDFLNQLRARLWAMPEADKQRSVDYYSEMIDDRMEDGLTEEEAVAAIGDLDEIVEQILHETPRPPAAPKQVKPEKKSGQSSWKVWVAILLVIGSPVWIPVMASLLATVVSVYVSLWIVVAVFYIVAVAVGAAAIGCVVGCFFMIGRAGVILVSLGAAALCAGLAILLFLLGNLAAKGMIALTKLCWQGAKSIFSRKERTV